MKRRTAVILLVVVALVLIAIGYGYREYYRKPALLDTVSPDVTVKADRLIADYKSNEEKANEKYLGKVVQVSGVIASINNEQDTVVNILLGKSDAMVHASCSMSAKSLPDTRSLKPDQQVTLRGVCTGFLMDVELNRCVVVK